MTSAGMRNPKVLAMAVLGVVFVMAAVTGLLTRIDLQGLNQLLWLNAQQRALPNDIVIVDIDQKSLEDMNAVAGSWPWPRAIHGELVEAIAAQQPKAIIFDLLFNEPDRFRPESDDYFASVAAQQPRLYLPTLLLADGSGPRLTQLPAGLHVSPGPKANAEARAPLLLPLITPPASWRGGLINYRVDVDDVGRHYDLYREVAGWRLPSQPARLAQDMGWPLPARDRILLNWYGDGSARYSYAELYQDLTSSAPRLGHILRDKIVLIGTAAPGLQDLRVTPLSNTYPGVKILATAIANLHSGDWLRQTRADIAFYPLLLVPLVLTFLGRPPLFRLALQLALATAALLATSWLSLHYTRLVLDVFAPLACAWLLYLLLGPIAWWQEREAAVALFGRFLDPRVVKELVQTGHIGDAQAASAREITILFSDIRGFTTLSETRTPEQIVDLLNRYFSRQVEVIFRHGGTLDKFIGDAIMAFWGAPTHDDRHAQNAVAAALEMTEELQRFRAELGELGQVFDIGIGVHTGPAVVGFIGARDRLDYTAIGDSVNLASRIEGQTKGVARVLVSEPTRQACGDTYTFTDHGLTHVKGREQGVRLYEPHWPGSPAAGEQSGERPRSGDPRP